MTVRPYLKEDFPQIAEWGRHYGASYEQSQFPQAGFIVDGVAAYFLYQTDSSVCFLENMIANKYVDRELKEQALALIVDAILSEAKRLDFKVAYATTGLPSLVFRAITAGATAQTKQILLTKNLSDPSNDGLGA